MVGDDTDGSGTTVTQVSNLDFGNPLYLHSSDTSITALISLKLKGTENYNVWSRAMICNYVVLSWILNSISEELFSGQVFSKYAKTFDALVKLPSCGCDNTEFKSHNDLIKLMHFLMGLDECYHAIISNILTRETLPSVQNAFSIMSREESQRDSSSATSSGSALKCYEIVAYPPGWIKRNNTNKNVTSNNAMSNNQGSPFTFDQINKLMSLINDISVTRSAQANVAVPRYCVNLLSVHQLSKNKRIFIGFNDSKCYIQDLLEKRIVGTGSMKNVLYLFDVCEGDYSNCVPKCYVSFNLWHCRLRHPSKPILDLLKHDLEWSGDLP
ncbi:uncharacterized protein [Rutidosis leptorrhynchoides]|uniref:uncharacterized protein n=1 Tax=Rutidosis leptorrhynchoides TaxID=125765 RepID=UPI003A991255